MTRHKNKSHLQFTDLKGWADLPPVPARWFDIDGSKAEALIVRIDEATEGSPMGVFSNRYPVEQIRAAELPFYPKHLLIDIQVKPPQDVAGAPSALASLIFGPTGVTFLDGSSLPIHDLNRLALKIVDEPMAKEYLRFFCAFVRGEEGPFTFVSSQNDCIFRKDAKLAACRKFLKSIFDPKPAQHKDHAGAGWCLKASVCYGGALFSSIFSVAPSGMIEMLEDTPLMPETPLVSRLYQGIYRLVSES